MLPVQYLGIARVSLIDGNVHNVDLTDNMLATIEDIVEQLQYNYQTGVARVDFKLNLEKIKDDISEQTRHFCSLF